MDSGKTVTVPGYANDQKRLSYVGGSESAKNGGSGSKVNSPNSAISPTSSKFDYRSLLKEKEQISEEQIKARADYLKKQRDKLLELKKIEQQKQLQEQTEKAALERPKTAKAARAAMESKLETRKAIASKLKAEVIDATDSKK
uniref:Uncharacterized protein n=1 Tax=Panagrolaimus sp. JU765 TaxID=591449 RepID=A0AC34Q0B2_9BILA